MFELLGKRFRATPAYECVTYDRLSSEEQSQLAGLLDNSDSFGVLRSTDPSLSLQSVDRDVALLFLALRDPGPLPGYFRRLLGARSEEVITRLVLNRVLEVELTDGDYVSGARFRESVEGELEFGLPAGDQLEAMALKSAQALGIVDVRATAAFLYNYNRLPASPRWREWFFGWSEGRAGSAVQLQPETWTREETSSWVIFTRSTVWAHPPQHAKLYVSPRPDELASIFPKVLEICIRFGALRFKIGRTLIDLLRPDKMVVYWSTLDEARRGGAALLAEVAGATGQRVPFTARIEDSDILSYGLDPPEREIVVSWQSLSWRGWVVERLAAALVAARSDPLVRIPAWKHALWSAHQHGVDVVNWAPSPLLWDHEQR